MFQSKRGLVLVRTATLLLLATYGDSMYPSVCVEAVEKLGNQNYCKVYNNLIAITVTVVVHG